MGGMDVKVLLYLVLKGFQYHDVPVRVHHQKPSGTNLQMYHHNYMPHVISWERINTSTNSSFP
jgi:hypothetical protein